MIDEHIRGYAAVAVRCREGGIDSVEVHTAHGYRIASFLSGTGAAITRARPLAGLPGRAHRAGTAGLAVRGPYCLVRTYCCPSR